MLIIELVSFFLESQEMIDSTPVTFYEATVHKIIEFNRLLLLRIPSVLTM